MTLRFRRTVQVAPGVRINVTKSGVGVRVGPRGAGVSLHSSGRLTTSAGLPGTGLYFTESTVLRRDQPSSRAEPALAGGSGAAGFLPDGELRRLRRRAQRDHRRGGGRSYDQLWQLAVARTQWLGAMLAHEAARDVEQVLTDAPELRREFIRELAGRLQPGAGSDVPPKALLDSQVSMAARDVGRQVGRQLVRSLVGQVDDGGTTAENDDRRRQLTAALHLDDETLAAEADLLTEHYAGLPFSAVWLESLLPKLYDSYRVALGAQISDRLFGQESSHLIGDGTSAELLQRAVDLLATRSPDAVADAAVLLSRAKLGEPDDGEVEVPVSDHLKITLPVDEDELLSNVVDGVVRDGQAARSSSVASSC